MEGEHIDASEPCLSIPSHSAYISEGDPICIVETLSQRDLTNLSCELGRQRVQGLLSVLNDFPAEGTTEVAPSRRSDYWNNIPDGCVLDLTELLESLIEVLGDFISSPCTLLCLEPMSIVFSVSSDQRMQQPESRYLTNARSTNKDAGRL